MANRIGVTLDLPEHVGDDVREWVHRKAHEATVLGLWEAGEISTRVAAVELGLEYQEFLDLIDSQGLPVVRGEINVEAIEAVPRKLAGR